MHNNSNYKSLVSCNIDDLYRYWPSKSYLSRPSIAHFKFTQIHGQAAPSLLQTRLEVLLLSSFSPSSDYNPLFKESCSTLAGRVTGCRSVICNHHWRLRTPVLSPHGKADGPGQKWQIVDFNKHDRNFHSGRQSWGFLSEIPKTDRVYWSPF